MAHMNESTPLITTADDTTNLLSSVAELEQQLQEQREDEESTDNVSARPSLRHQRTLSFDFVMETIVDVTESFTEGISDVKDAVVEGMAEVKDVIETVLEEEIQPIKPRAPEAPAMSSQRTKLSAVALSILVFYKVSGGPFGCEPTVRAAGPFYSLLGFILFPLVWSLQEAMVTAELGAAYPEPSGAIAWIEEAFGPKAGLLCGYFHWVSGATDNAIYPSLMLEYISSYMSGLHPEDSSIGGDHQQSWMSNEMTRFSLAVAITALLSFISYRGLDVVGSLSSVVCVISMSPFVLLCIFGLPHIQPSRWMVLPVASEDEDMLVDDDALSGDTFFPEITYLGILWRPFVNNLFWNLNSFDVGASFAGEVHNPGVVFPRAMMLSLALVWLSYVLPLLVALGASDTLQQDWKAGHLTVVAQEVVGSWLAAWTVLAAAVSNVALFLAEMSGDAYQLMGMADRGLIPKVFCKRSRFQTPTNGILLGTMIIVCLSVANFDALVEMLNFAYSFALLMEFAAFIKLRVTEDEDAVERPFRLPFGVFGCVLFVLPSCLICILIMVTASKMTYLYIFFLVVFGACFHLVQKAAHHYKWWDYVQAASKKGKRGLAAADAVEVVVHA